MRFGVGVRRLGFGDSVSGSGVWGLRLGVWGLGFAFWGLGSRVSVLGSRVSGRGFQSVGFKFRRSGFRATLTRMKVFGFNPGLRAPMGWDAGAGISARIGRGEDGGWEGGGCWRGGAGVAELNWVRGGGMGYRTTAVARGT